MFRVAFRSRRRRQSKDFQRRHGLTPHRRRIGCPSRFGCWADPNAVNTRDETPLHTCRDVGTIETLLADPRTKLEPRDSLGFTPLLRALESNQRDIAHRLIDSGADVTAVDNLGNGVWHHLFPHQILGGPEPKLHIRLTELGANPNTKNQKGRTFLHEKMVGYRPTIYELKDFKAALDDFVSVGADLEMRDNNGETVLHRFIRKLESGCAKEIFDILVKAGARTDSLDFKGRNLYLACLRSHRFWLHPELIFELLPDCNIDPKHIDNEGNTLLHETCIIAGWLNRERWTPSLESVIRNLEVFGIDKCHRNNFGRTPLHLACMYGTFRLEDFEETYVREEFSLVSYLLGQKVDIDSADTHGFTALHFASTCSELNTDLLLEAGADIFKKTHEGLTVLHLAARSRQANILGMLLEYLKSQSTSEKSLRLINRKDNSPQQATALYYACASGQPLSVRLLLEAGATVETPSATGSPWLTCANFEEEQKNWQQHDEEGSMIDTEYQSDTYPYRRRRFRRPFKESVDTEPDARGLLLGDKKRRKDPANTNLCTRLEEILDLLVQYGSTKYIEDAIIFASAHNFDYTVDRLNAKWKELADSLRTKLCLKRIEAQRQFLGDVLSSSQELKSKYNLLMSLREYDLVCQLLKDTEFEEIDDTKSDIIYALLAGGFTFILKSFLTRKIISNLDEREKRKPEVDVYYEDMLRKPFLFEACRTALPNMDLIRFLIEELGININTRSMQWTSLEGPKSLEYRYPYRCLMGYIEDETALFTLMTHNHWWQIAQALPYFIEHGANIEARDLRGPTPLYAAIDRLKLGYPATQRAIKRMVSLGASPKVVGKNGRTGLELASCNIDIFRLLLQYGADITPGALLNAIHGRKYDILEALLEAGANPNERRTGSDRKEIPEREMYPLRYAIYRDFRASEESEDLARGVKILLNYGAEPFARYPRSTVMHQVIVGADHHCLSVFLALPDLKLEERDEEGFTILLKACERKKLEPKSYGPLGQSLLEVLIDRGADIRARSNDGKTILHHIIEFHTQTDQDILKTLLERAPDLINAADNEGVIPLHSAIEKTYYKWELCLGTVGRLLAAGADPKIAKKSGETLAHILAAKEWTINENGDFDSSLRKFFEHMLAQGVDANGRDQFGDTPLFRFFRSGTVSQTLPPNDTCGVQAVYDEMRANINELPVLEMFDRAGMDWKAVNNAGQTLLHVVATDELDRSSQWLGRAARRFKFLMEKGVNVTGR
ncbi:Alpha-latrocrustotoxin [Arthrobotrys entomopaga]|nr:Alpha-latrocrustotoxin [Arthrobotrys entomopaga]